MKETIIELAKLLSDKEVADSLAKAAKALTDAFIDQGFTKSEAIELLTHIKGN